MADVSNEVNATGRRKSAVARVRMRPGTGIVLVNGRPVAEYFPRESLVNLTNQPLELTGGMGRYDIIANISGGGVSGQAGALRHGIARAVEKFDAGQRGALKRGGMLTRDARQKERKKYGQRGARARFQFSKR